MSKRNGKNLICSKCSAEYYVRANRCDKSKFCPDCWKERNLPEVKKCVQCNIGLLTYERKTKRFCSMGCRDKYSSIHRIGINANSFKDGKSLERERARRSKDLKIWKTAVKERDSYTCQDCGKTDELHAHHIIEWSKDESKRFDVGNGLTLCIDCHGKVHGRNFRKVIIDRMLKLDSAIEIKKNGQPYDKV